MTHHEEPRSFRSNRTYASHESRLRALEDEIYGTHENGYRDGIKSELRRVKRAVNVWGAILAGVILGTGAVNGTVAKAIGQLLAGIGSG